MKKIVITTTSFAEFDNTPVELCLKKGLEISYNTYKRKLKESELIEIAKDAVGIIAGTETIAKEALSKLPQLKVISRCGAGIENIDINAAKGLGIKIFNTPDAPTLAVAELTIGVILALLRKIPQASADIKTGRWEKNMGNLLHGKKVGIIGFGRIGKKVTVLLKALGCETAYFDLSNPSMAKNDLLKWADIISIHTAGKEIIIGKNELQLMNKGSWLVNVSRGEAVDEAVLYEYLSNGHLNGAALDVFTQEPYNGPLTKLNNVILTPHIGSYAVESRIKMELEAVENLIKGLGC